MLTLPPRLAKTKARKNPGDVPAHRKWVRGFSCVVKGCDNRPIEAAHVRLGLPNGEQPGTGKKPHDKWCFPLCSAHHSQQHTVGEATFAKMYGLNLVAVATAFANASPHKRKWEDG